ncbi:MAG: ATP-binding protein [Kofleriaceae bacterium]
MAFQKAVKTKAKLRLAFAALAGAGKTYSSLAIGSAIGALMRKNGHGDGRIAVIDSERGSASLYADRFDFDVCELVTFSPMLYVEKIHEAERAGYDIIIIDSLSHAWAGKDGALEKKDNAAERGGNSWTAWRDVTPMHNALVDAMLGSPAHVIATMRQKMEYVQETNAKGKTEIRKVGLQSIQREGMEYEFTLFGDISLEHIMKIAKSRCDGVVDIGDMFEKPGAAFAERIYGWLMSGADAKPRQQISVDVKLDTAKATEGVERVRDAVADAIDASFDEYLKALDNAQTLPDLDKAATSASKPAKGTANYAKAGERYMANKARIERAMAQAGGEAVAS